MRTAICRLLTLLSAVTPAPAPAPAPALAPPSSAVVARARLEIARGVTYDPAWFAIGYPNGDPAPDKGVCTDVVIRSLRAVGIDLQELVHEDILRRPAAYATVTRPHRQRSPRAARRAARPPQHRSRTERG